MMDTHNPTENQAVVCTAAAGHLDSFDAVYYAQQVPASAESLTILSLVFDRIFFPGVYLPTSEFDEDALRREIERIRSLRMKFTIEDVQLLDCLNFSLHVKYVRDFCIFTGSAEGTGTTEPEVGALMAALEELIYGPPPPGFTPTHSLRFSKGFDFSDNRIEHQVNAPSWLAYPANALVYAMKHNTPLVNDSGLPVPGLPLSPKDNAKLLATILAIESVKLALPKLKPLMPKELVEFRAETSQYVKPFRVAMLRLAKDLNAALESDMKLHDVQKQAQFLVETTVYPELCELEAMLTDPSKSWRKRVIELARSAPELLTNFATMPKNVALAKAIGAIAKALADVRDEQLDRENRLARSGIYYLLKLHGGG
jgi:hypothetical protein